MQQLEKIKLALGLFLILFGLYFGFAIIAEKYPVEIAKSPTFVLGGASSVAATSTPIYAGLCILAGAYIIANVNNEKLN